MNEFYVKIPKVELHAHLSGSVSLRTLLSILDETQRSSPILQNAVEKGGPESLEEGFQLFPLLHDAITSPEIIENVVVDVIEEFASDGVIYLELRTTLRPLPTHRDCLDAILRGIVNAPSVVRKKIIARLLLSLDRARGADEALMVVMLVTEYVHRWPEIIVGVELSGNPSVGTLLDFADPLNSIQSIGLKTSVHLAEVPNEGEQWLEFLQLHTPNRIGHGTFIPTPNIPSDGTPAFKARDLILHSRIPIEMCLTSNVKCATVPNYESHHLGSWIGAGHPVCICTDDKGLFCCSASGELAIAVERFGISKLQLQKILTDSANAAFCSNATKNELVEQIDRFFKTQTR